MNPSTEPSKELSQRSACPPLVRDLSVEDMGEAIRVGDIVLKKRLQQGKVVSGIAADVVFTPFDLNRWLFLAEAISYRKPAIIQGGAGTGKTAAVIAFANALNYPLQIVDCATTPIEDIIGKAGTTTDTATYPSGFRFYPGPAYRAVQGGAILCFDEWNFTRVLTRGRLHPFFDALFNQSCRIHVPENEGEVLVPHPDFRLIALQNPPGEEYRGREVLDESQYGRWSFLNEPLDMPHEDKVLHWMGTMRVVFGADSVDGNEALRAAGERFIDVCDKLTKMIADEEIAAGEAQRPYVTFRRDLEKIKRWLAQRPDIDFAASMQDALCREILRKFRPHDHEKVLSQLRTVKYAGPELRPRASTQMTDLGTAMRRLTKGIAAKSKEVVPPAAQSVTEAPQAVAKPAGPQKDLPATVEHGGMPREDLVKRLGVDALSGIRAALEQ